MKKLFLLALLLIPASSQAALVNFNGFDYGDDSNFIASANMGFDCSTPIDGDCSFSAVPVTTGISYVSLTSFELNGFGSTGMAANRMGFEVRINTLPSATEQIVTGWNGGTKKCSIMITSAGVLQLLDSTGAQVDVDSPVVASGDYINWLCPNGTAATGSVDINGVTVISGVGNFLTGNSTIHSLGKRQNTNGSGYDIDFDVTYRDTTTYLGDSTSKIVVLKPTANGAAGMAWTAGDATCNATPADCWQQVDDTAPFDTTTYVQSTAASTTALFEMTNSSTAGIGASDTIHGMLGMIMVREVSASATGRVQGMIVSGAATSTNNNINQTTIYFPAMLEIFTDPNTGTTWTTSGIDAIQYGCWETAASTVQHRCTAVQDYVFITPAVVPPSTGTDDIIFFE